MYKKLIKLPILLVALFMTAMGIMDYLNTDLIFYFQNKSILSIVIFLIGVTIIGIGGFVFKREKTTVNPMFPERATFLVTTHIYRYSRNPMYVGFFLWLLASFLYIGNYLNIILLPFYIVLVNKLYIIPEEVALKNLFGKDFDEYKGKVRRWV